MPTIHPTSLPFALANASNTNAAKHIKVPFVRKKFAHPSIAQPAYTVVRSGIEHMFIAIAENSIPLTSASTAKDPTQVATMPRLSVASRSGTVEAKKSMSPAKTQQTSPMIHSL